MKFCIAQATTKRACATAKERTMKGRNRAGFHITFDQGVNINPIRRRKHNLKLNICREREREKDTMSHQRTAQRPPSGDTDDATVKSLFSHASINPETRVIHSPVSEGREGRGIKKGHENQPPKLINSPLCEMNDPPINRIRCHPRMLLCQTFMQPPPPPPPTEVSRCVCGVLTIQRKSGGADTTRKTQKQPTISEKKNSWISRCHRLHRRDTRVSR